MNVADTMPAFGVDATTLHRARMIVSSRHCACDVTQRAMNVFYKMLVSHMENDMFFKSSKGAMSNAITCNNAR